MQTEIELLAGTALRQFQEALLDAFPSWDDLEQMVRLELDQNLEAIVPKSDLTTATFKLIHWAQRTGRLEDLLAGARRANPGNPKLQAFGGFPKATLGKKRVAGAPDPAADRNRARMIQKLRDFWIGGVLEHSLHGAAPITLGLTVLPDAVAHPWAGTKAHYLGQPKSLPSGTSITAVFDQRSDELLILGAPGAGKTTTLLMLARELLDRAEQDAAYPIPVIFNLSSWAGRRRNPPLSDWLVGELNRQYDVPRKVAEAWVEAGEVLPLLDGLDDVPKAARAACVEAINAFHAEHGFLGIVVSCRVGEYEALGAPLKLQGAVLVQPLSATQIDAYLASAEAGATRWAEVLEQDAALHELAQSPLMLSIMARTYADAPLSAGASSVEERRRQLLDAYVDRMWRGVVAYPRERAIRWLARLALTVQQSGEQVFFIEHMQPTSWLGSSGRWRYAAGVGALIAVMNAVAYSLGGYVMYRGMPISPMADSEFLPPLYGLVFGLVPGVVFGLVGGGRAWMIGTITTRWPTARFLPTALATGLLIGAAAAALTMSMKLDRVLLPGRFFTGAVSGVLAGVLAGLFPEPEQIAVVETIQWSWARLWTGLRRRWVTCGVAGILFAAANATPALVNGHPEELKIFSALGMLSGTAGAAIVIGLGAGLSTGLVEQRTRPNEGIHRSVRFSAQIGLATTLVVATFVAVVGRAAGGFQAAAPIMGLAMGIAVGLRYGGLASIQHAVLRLLVWRDGAGPWRYRRFLDFCAERIFLRKVGGGYMFVHRLVMEHFAKQLPTGVADEQQARPAAGA